MIADTVRMTTDRPEVWTGRLGQKPVANDNETGFEPRQSEGIL